nr:autophagy-related protein 16-like isoform X2 [Anolis sagrei ordinatus]
MKPSGAWRQHVRAELRRREGRAAGWRAALQRHERLEERLEAQQAQLAEGLLHAGGERGGGGPRRDPGALDLAALHLQLQMDVAQLRQEREELRQQVAFLAEALREAEAENQEQRARMGRLAQEASSLGREFEEAQCKAWSLRREAEGLRAELSGARALLREARRERMELEARWVQEKALEAQRLNGANRRQEKYQRKVTLLQETLERMREASAAATGDADGTEEGAPAKGSSLSSSSEEAEMDTGGGCGGGQAEGRPPSPLPLPAGAEAGRS